MKIKTAKSDIPTGNLLGDYSRKKLYCLSRTYGDLANLYRTNQDLDDAKYIDRKDIFYTKQLLETREVFADQLEGVSGAFLDVADTIVRVSTPLEHKKKALIGFLKKQGIMAREIVFLEGDNRRITIEARTIGRCGMSVEVLGRLISDFFGRNLVSTSDSAQVLYRNYDIFIYEDGPKYAFLSSVSRAVKENEKISGDNFSIAEYNQNMNVLMISDGMGSGEQANNDSQKIIEYMEKFLDAGFDKERAFSMINATVASRKESFRLTTLDLCSINLMDGEIEFMKAGAAPSFIKRGKRVDKISSDTLPLGSHEGTDPLIQTTRITNNDILVMVSDGIIDAIEAEGLTTLECIISRSNALIPYELSDYILKYAIRCQNGRIRDDMTVLTGRIASKI